MSNLLQPPDREQALSSAPLEEAIEPPASKIGGSRWRLRLRRRALAETGFPHSRSRWSLARPRLGVAWIAAVLIAYYLLHLPFSPNFLAALFAPAHQLALDWQTPLRLLGHAADVLVAAWLLLLGAALGRQLWRWLHLPAAEETVQVALASGLGLGALSLLTFVFGLAGWLSFWTVGAGLLILSLLCARAGWQVLGWLGEQTRLMVRSIRQASWL
ncbi:MAG TPA: hypothetical protein VFU69_12135, partial [Ktedonobacterales bacterium]|nr:hypothetical protein [Ktedonobacterales bacterium]